MEAHSQIWKKSNLVNHLIARNNIRFSINNRSLYSSYNRPLWLGMKTFANICIQSRFHIDKSGYNSDADWVFLTTRHVHLSRWSVVAHSDRGQAKTTLDIEWYVRLSKKSPIG